ncbi:MAG TPA: TMEM175 family protein [Streptosporangiaceae bacterium]|jgi:uncharacterized membrane protein
MATSDSPEIEARAADRVVVFSDAVVAIAITLLALELPSPNTGDNSSDLDVLRSLGHHWAAYFAFFISFVVISGAWGSHRAIFRYVNRINDKVIGTNMIWLLMVVLTPFAARTLAAGGGFQVRFSLYALVQVIAASCLVRMSNELAQGHLLRDDAPESARHPDNLARYATIGAFLISIPVSFVSPWAYAIWAAGPAFALRIMRNRNRLHIGR